MAVYIIQEMSLTSSCKLSEVAQQPHIVRFRSCPAVHPSEYAEISTRTRNFSMGTDSGRESIIGRTRNDHARFLLTHLTYCCQVLPRNLKFVLGIFYKPRNHFKPSIMRMTCSKSPSPQRRLMRWWGENKCILRRRSLVH